MRIWMASIFGQVSAHLRTKSRLCAQKTTTRRWQDMAGFLLLQDHHLGFLEVFIGLKVFTTKEWILQGLRRINGHKLQFISFHRLQSWLCVAIGKTPLVLLQKSLYLNLGLTPFSNTPVHFTKSASPIWPHKKTTNGEEPTHVFWKSSALSSSQNMKPLFDCSTSVSVPSILLSPQPSLYP